MGMNVNVGLVVVDNPHPKDLSKSPAVAGVFVSPHLSLYSTVMKKILVIILFLSAGYSQKEYNIKHIVEQSGVYKKKFSDEIVNGKVFLMYGDMKVSLGKMKNGKKDGKWKYWRENGLKWEEGIYKDGKEDGLWTTWYVNGQKEREATFKYGKIISSKCWDEDGNECECGKYGCKSGDTGLITNDQLINDFVEVLSQTHFMAVEPPLKLKIVTTERIWYSMATDTEAAQTGILSPGEEKSLAFENQINVRLNQTAGTAMYINGMEVAGLGATSNHPAEIYFFAETSTITVKHYLPQR